MAIALKTKMVINPPKMNEAIVCPSNVKDIPSGLLVETGPKVNVRKKRIKLTSNIDKQ
jgi:hypothetical protein